MTYEVFSPHRRRRGTTSRTPEARPAPLADGRVNLRGRRVIVELGDDVCREVNVVTHIRGDRWLVAGPELPSRCRRPFGGRRLVVREQHILTVVEPEAL